MSLMEVHVVDYSPDNNGVRKKSPTLPKILVAFATALLMINVAILSFFIGRNTMEHEPTQVSGNGFGFNSPEALVAESSQNNVSGAKDEEKDKDSPFSTPSPTPVPIKNELVINSEPRLDGFRTSNGSGSSVSAIQIGSNSELVSRGFVTFDLQPIPSRVRILQARLRLFIVKEEGNSNRLGDLLVDHLRYGDSLDAVDFSSVAIISSFTGLQQDPDDEQWLTADVTGPIINDIDSARSDSQFRLHFENESKTDAEEFYYLESAENYLSSNNPPQLLITYLRN